MQEIIDLIEWNGKSMELKPAIPNLKFLTGEAVPKEEILRDFPNRPRIFHECANIGAQIRFFAAYSWMVGGSNRPIVIFLVSDLELPN